MRPIGELPEGLTSPTLCEFKRHVWVSAANYWEAVDRVVLLEQKLANLLARIDEMPNPHSDPMRHYYNQMQVWKEEAR